MKTICNTMDDYQLIELLADIEHQQWMNWATTVMNTESISDERKERWKSYMVPYHQLSEEIKEYDREYARKVWSAVKPYLK